MKQSIMLRGNKLYPKAQQCKDHPDEQALNRAKRYSRRICIGTLNTDERRIIQITQSSCSRMNDLHEQHQCCKHKGRRSAITCVVQHAVLTITCVAQEAGVLPIRGSIFGISRLPLKRVRGPTIAPAMRTGVFSARGA